jgi:hypothetical protein
MSDQNNALTVIPTELKNQLPIFQVIGDKLPAPLKTEEGKKTVASVFYWALLIGGAYWFFRNIDTFLACTEIGTLRGLQHPAGGTAAADAEDRQPAAPHRPDHPLQE